MDLIYTIMGLLGSFGIVSEIHLHQMLYVYYAWETPAETYALAVFLHKHYSP